MSKHQFNRNFAVVIGINDYTNGIRELETAVPDAYKLAQILQKQYQALKQQYQAQNRYEVQLILNQRATFNQLNQLISDFKNGQIPLDNEKVTVTEDDRVFFYFAGHGIALEALENQEGPVGYLIPQDATLGDSSTYLPMQELHDALNALPCRHMLAILDCCFAGAFRWASLKREIVPKVTVYKERYDRFISDRAWQVITSAADDQKALDSLGLRGKVIDGDEVHSPFAKALFDALRGGADEGADFNKDGIITATELYLYLRDHVEILTENHYKRQTPGLCPLKKHDKGEFIFLLPDFDRDKLEDAPPLNLDNNPYRGLQSYDEKDSHLFFGRNNLIEKLCKKAVDSKQPLTLVLGASGTGKSSLMKAGLLPRLRDSQEHQFKILDPMRPGESPLKALAQVCLLIAPTITAAELAKDEQALANIIERWSKNYPNTKLLLPVDQFEELITLCKSDQEREQFQKIIKNALAKYPNKIHVVITLRLDFEAQFQNSVLKDFWNDDTRFVVPPMTQDEFREAIEKPASEKVVYFDPPTLVDELINEVVQMPGALPLLSFTLSELYLKYLEQRRDNRALKKEDYEELGRVVGSLTKRANQEYDHLVKEDSAYKDTVRRVMLRMISLQGGELARRQVLKSELMYANEEENKRVQTVIKRFSDARLIVEGSNSQGKAYVEPAHDALVQGWNKLLEWKKEEEENLILQRRLTPAAEELKSVSSNLQPLGWQTKCETVIDWLDRRFYTIENFFTKISTQIARLGQKSQNQQERSREKPVQFLWNTNPYLTVLDKEFKSPNNWLNQVEAEFVQQSVLQKRRNISWRWRIATAVILGLSGLTIAALIGQRNAQIGQVRASRASAEANFRINEQLNALVDSLRSGKNIKQIFLPGNDLQNQVGQTLRNMFYGVKESNRWEAPPGIIRSMFFTSDRQLLVITNDNDDKVRLWDKYGKLVAELQGQKGLFQGGISVSPDGSKIATATQDGTLRLWDLKGNKLTEFQAHQGSIQDISFSPDGKTIATAGAISGEEKAVRLWDLQGNKIKGSKFPTGTLIIGLGFKRSSELLIATLGEDRIKVLDFSGENSQEVRAFKNTYGTSLIKVSFRPNRHQAVIYYGEESENASLWDFSKRGEPEDISQKISGNGSSSSDGNLYRISRGGGFSPDGNQLAATGVDGTVNFLNVNDNVQNKFKLPQGRVKMSTFSPDGKQIVTLGDDNNIRLWDLEKQALSKSKLVQNRVESISFSSDGRTIATADSEGVVRLLDLQGNQIKEFIGLPKVTSVSFSPNGQTIATTGDGGMVRLLDLQGKLVKEFQAHPQKVESVSWSQDSQKIGTIGDGGTEPIDGSKDKSSARLWDTQGKSLKKEEDRKTSEFQSIGFQPNGEPIALTKGVTNQVVGNIDKSDFSGGSTNLIPGRQAKNTFNSVKISQDGSLFLTTSNNTVQLWNLRGEKLIEFSSDKGDIKSLSLSLDNSILAVITEDGTTELWRLGKFDELLTKGCDRLRDYLENNRNVSESDRNLCDDIPPITSSPQTTTANSSAPSIVQPSAQNAPSPAPSSKQWTK